MFHIYIYKNTLISPSIFTGVDFPNAECVNNIIVKILYSNNSFEDKVWNLFNQDYEAKSIRKRLI
ncbi:MAG: hypothetical protein LBR15_07795 [Methanobrevibacter sp.]|jgi:hypothetical protein|nr:hypothetical protein [Candidatus Methanovirga australis]